MKELNKKLYATELLNDWVTREEIIPAEAYFINKYVTHKAGTVIEAGTGGGRLAFYIEQMGFNRMVAFDYVPQMIEYANKNAKNKNSTIKFVVADATNLSDFSSDAYDYLIYLQQVLCFIEEEQQFHKALSEAYRIAKKDSITVFSFLDYHSRITNTPLRMILRVLRWIRKEPISDNYLPWLKLNNSFNWKLLSKNQALTYWVKRDEILMQLNEIGFKVLEVKNASEINTDAKQRKGMLYVVCGK
jgi:ubiquinone/menaquinone biosynthesis C-methylase UbiE